MSGVEVLAGLGLMATQLFKYNRENYEFDQDQRFEREECRLKMQIERFALFREDIRDLVELTVGKMDLYHLIGALFLKMIVLYYCVGFFEREPPPFILCLYYMSNASSWVFLMLAIWLAMHASIASHSYGTRLLTRFVRLPIPGSAQMNVLNARYADFEKQGLQMWRAPFVGKQANTWQQRHAHGHLAKDLADDAEKQKQLAASLPANKKGGASSSAGGQPGTHEDWLGQGEYAYGGFNDIAGREAEMLRAVEFRTHRHVELFRELQSQWQCYDAYARVAMSLGVREMIQSLSYYLMGLCLVDQQALFVAYVLVICLQGLALAIYVLDIHGMPCYGNLDLSLAGAAPTIVALVQLTIAPRTAEGHLVNENTYRVACACFLLEICWMHLSLWAASPTDRENAMPRHFRSVLFMDVFAEVDDPLSADAKGKNDRRNRKQLTLMDRRVEGAEAALFDAQAVLRRWEAAPLDCLTEEQSETLREASRETERWICALSRELQIRRMPGLEDELKHRRPFSELTTAEKEEDPFLGTVVGPFPQSSGAGLESKYYYDPEANEYLYELSPDRRPLNLQEVRSLVQGFVEEVESVCATVGCKEDHAAHQHGKGTDGDSEDDEEVNTPLTRARSASTLASKAHTPSHRQAPSKLRPNRMPWQLVYYITRGIQVVWFFVFIMFLLNATGAMIVDCQVNPRKYYRSESEHEHSGSHPRELARKLAGELTGELTGELAGIDDAGSGEPASGAHASGEHTTTEHVNGEHASGEHTSGEHTSGEHASGEHTSGEQLYGGSNMCELPHLRRLRRLQAKDWRPQQHLASVNWPNGKWFRAERLSCLPGKGGWEGQSDVLVSTPFAMYKVSPRAIGGEGLELEELPSEAFAPSATSLCTSAAASPSAAPSSCLLAAAAPHGGLDLWPLGALRHGKRTWRLEGEPWRFLAGAVVPCSAATTGITIAQVGAPHCLLLAGVPASGIIQVALKPLPVWPLTEAAGATVGGQLVAQFELPVVPDADSLRVPSTMKSKQKPAGPSFVGPAALHVDPKDGRLWVLTREGELIAWALLEGGPPRLEGRWSVRASKEVEAKGGFHASALCQDQASGDLLVAGRVVGPQVEGPVLLRGQAPRL